MAKNSGRKKKYLSKKIDGSKLEIVRRECLKCEQIKEMRENMRVCDKCKSDTNSCWRWVA